MQNPSIPLLSNTRASFSIGSQDSIHNQNSQAPGPGRLSQCCTKIWGWMKENPGKSVGIAMVAVGLATFAIGIGFASKGTIPAAIAAWLILGGGGVSFVGVCTFTCAKVCGEDADTSQSGGGSLAAGLGGIGACTIS